MTSKLSNYSTTPASNNAASPNGWAEGALPSTLNDCNREFAARVREWYEDPEWVDHGHTIVSSTGTSIKVSGDYTSVYVAGRAIRVNQSASQDGWVSASAYSAPDTSITVSGFTVSSPTQVEVGAISSAASLPSTIAASGSITASGLTMATSRLLGRTTASSGAVEEISVGAGLTLATGSISAALRQKKVFEYTTTGTTTNTIPFDNTIPQNTEGDQIFSESFTPTAADSIILVEAFIQVGNSANYTSVAMFKDTTANAVSASWASVPGSSGITTAYVAYKETASSTSARTYKVRYGAANGGNTASVNQSQGGVGFGAGTIKSILQVTEYAP